MGGTSGMSPSAAGTLTSVNWRTLGSDEPDTMVPNTLRPRCADSVSGAGAKSIEAIPPGCAPSRDVKRSPVWTHHTLIDRSPEADMLTLVSLGR